MFDACELFLNSLQCNPCALAQIPEAVVMCSGQVRLATEAFVAQASPTKLCIVRVVMKSVLGRIIYR